MHRSMILHSLALLLAVLVCLSGVASHGSPLRFSLCGSNWYLQEQGKEVKYSAVVPGSVYTDLFRNGAIDNPYYRFNDLDYRWISYSNWTYSSTFTVEENVTNYNHIRLLVGGIDTVATIRLNGHVIGETDNMFRRYIFDIGTSLKSGTNDIEIQFESPVNYAAKQALVYPYDVPNDCPSEAQNGECHVNFIRKEASSFSWDWGPAFPTMGIWRNLEIEAFQAVAFRYISTETNMDEDNWLLTVGVFLEISVRTSVVLFAEVKELNVNCSSHFALEAGSNVKGEIPCPIPKGTYVQAWWPNGHGASKLYNVSVSILNPSSMSLLDHRVIRTGFRTVELVQDPIINASGLSFYFRINGEPIFMKGSNWIPADSFQERITSEYLRLLLGSAVEANINMLRVWGGGVYESEEFYELADVLGILIWQDFMFACNLYPANSEYLDNVREEVTHQVRRLKKHPSIIIWSGNNENEGAFSNTTLGYHSHPTPKYLQYYKDYIALYIQTIYDVVKHEDPRSRPFVSSSPSNGIETIAEGWVARNPQDTYYGDVHHYDYFSDSWNWTVYPIPRFASEFGLQSWCSFETLENVSIAEDWDEKSNFSFHRQHHQNGQQQIHDQISQHFRLPESPDPTQRFMDYIYLSQINQAMGIRTEAELYRRMQGNLDSKGQGHTMGSLYWQLNDIWQAPTWASIEYGGKWKMLHYFAKHFYDHIVVSPIINSNLLEVYFINEEPASQRLQTPEKKSASQRMSDHDRLNHLNSHQRNVFHLEQDTELTLSIKMYSWESVTPLKDWTHTFAKTFKTSSLVFENDLDEMVKGSKCASVRHCFIFTSVSINSQVHFNWLPLSSFKDAEGLQKATIKILSVKQAATDDIAVTLTANAIAPFVWMNARGFMGHFSSNGFLFIPAQPIVIHFLSTSPVTDLKAFENSLEVKSLMDVY